MEFVGVNGVAIVLFNRREIEEMRRQVQKLEHWEVGAAFALDLDVTSYADLSIFEVQVQRWSREVFRFAFCLDSLDINIRVIGVRAATEPITSAMMESLSQRRSMVLEAE